MTNLVNITRHKENRWQVKIRIAGKAYTKAFSDNKYGGQDNSLKAAIDHRDMIYQQHNLKPRKTPQSGPIVGVSRTSSERKKYAGGPLSKEEYWQAIWIDDNGKQHTKRFSIKKYGEEKAERKAIQARKDALDAIEKGFDPRFIQPSNKYAKLWRYMDFTKFLSLIEDSAIFLAPATSFEDPYEGFLPKGNSTLSTFVKSKSKNKGTTRVIVADKNNVLISCWHMSRYESAAMWKLYGKGNETICITTKYAKLKNQLIHESQIGLVQYVNFNTAWTPENNPYYPYMFKRKSFEHEKEVRVLVDQENIDQEDFFLKSSNGFKNKVDLNTLIDEIFVAPDSSDWFYELVKKIARNYELEEKVKRSTLLEIP